MSTTAFPVRQDTDGVGCTDVMLRRIFGALYPTKGIITGLAVTGQNALSYKVAEGVAVCSKGESDGSTLAYFEGGEVETEANTAANPRIDVVYIESHDITQGDEDNLVTLGVVQGTAAASPVEPDVPTYGTKLAAMQVPANATTTASATAYGTVAYSVPYGGSSGMLAQTVNTKTETISSEANVTYDMVSTTFTVPTKRLVEFDFNSATNSVNAGCSWGIFAFVLDGEDLPNSTVEFLADTVVTRDCPAHYLYEVEAGSHTIHLRIGKMSDAGSGRSNGAPRFLYGNAATGRNYKGRTLTVWDRGVAD